MESMRKETIVSIKGNTPMACNGQIQCSTLFLFPGINVLGTPTSQKPLTGLLGPILTAINL